MTMVERVLASAVLIAGLALAMGQAAAQTDPPKPALPPAAPPATAPASPDTVTGAAAWEKLKGNTISGKVGGQAFAEYFDAGGSVRYVDKDGLSTGTWSLQSPKVCFDFPEDDDRSCSTFSVTGSTGTALEDDNTTTRFDILPGNSKGL